MLKSALSLLLLSCLLGRLDCTELTVKQGADATLQCSGHRDADAIMIRWYRRDLQSEDYVFYFKDGHVQEELQHELFKGRVKLKDPDWKKTRDFSVILKHVTTNDAGTYECHAGYEGQRPELLSSLILKVEKPDIKLLTVKCGDNATLQCNGTRDAAVIMLRWRKPDQQSDLGNTNKQLYVLFIRDGHTYENFQLPSFKGRVQLRDPQMKDGDLSVIIKNVSTNDTGIYECYAGYDKEEPQLMSSTKLTVEESGQTGGQSGDGGKEDGGEKRHSVGLIVAAVLFAGVVGFLLYKKFKNQ